MNALEGVLDNPVVVKLGLALVHFLWQGTAIALVVALILACLRKATANSRYLVLLVALALMAAAPVATFLLMSAAPRQSERALSVGPTPRPASSLPQVPVPSTTAALAYPEAADASPGSKPAAHASRLYASLLLARLDDLVPWAVVLWMTGVLVLSLRLIGRWRAVERAKRRAVQLAGDRWRQTVAELSQRLSISRSVRVLESAVIRIPTVLGWLRPVILLPATALTGLTPEQWQAILAHELAHVRRNDYLVNLAQTVVETLLFYHPAVWWLSSRIRTEREHCCDDLAVAACGDAVVYMRALAALEQLGGAPEPALGAGGGSLVKRVRRVAGAAHTRPSHLPAWLAGAVALMVVAAVAIRVQAWGVASRPSEYDHFLFVRTDNIEGQPGGTDTLVMAKVTPEGFELRDFHSKNNLGVGLKYLGVFGGQAYLMKIDQVYRLDLATGRFSPVTEPLQLHDYVDGRLFTVEGGGAIREYDLRAGTYREVTIIPDQGATRLRASPDGKRLAFFTQVPSDTYGYADQLNVIDVERGTIRQVGGPLRFFQMAASSTPAIGPPFVWLNDKEILLARTEGQGRRDASGREFYREGDLVDHLAVISVETGETRDVTAIPGQPSVRQVEIETPDLVSLPVLLLSDAGVGRARYLVDPRAGKLVESDGIGGDFHLRVTVRPNGETHHQLYHGTELLGAEKGYTSARVSPDGKRVIWAGDWAVELNYYDSQVGRVRPVAKIWSLDSYESLLWFSGEDLRPAPPIRLAAGWREMREPAEPDQAGSAKAGQSGPGKPPAAPSEALRPDWGPKRVSQRFAGTAQVVHRFVSRMSYSSGRDPEAERELLAQGRTRAQADLRGLLRELPPSDRFRFMVAFTMYWMGLDPQSSRAVMLEYCPPGNKPGYQEETIIFLDYAYRKRPDRRLLEGILGWVPQSDGAGAEVLARILSDKARSVPRDLLAALKSKPSLLWSRAANLLFDPAGESPERAYPALVAIASDHDDPLYGSARQLLREMASSWPSPSQWPPASPDAVHAAPPGKVLRILIPRDIDAGKLTILCGEYANGLGLGPIDTKSGIREYQVDLHGTKSVRLLIYYPGYRMVSGEFEVARMPGSTAFAPTFAKLPMVPLRVRLVDSKGRPLVGEQVVLRHTLMEMKYFNYGDGMVYPAVVATATTSNRGEIEVEVPSLPDDPYFSVDDKRWPVAFEPSLPRHRGGAYGWDFVPRTILAQRSYPGRVTMTVVDRGRVSGRVAKSFAARARGEAAGGERRSSASYILWLEAEPEGKRTGVGTRVNTDGTFAITLPAGRYNLSVELRRNGTKSVGRVPVETGFVLGEREHRVLRLD